MYCSNSVTEWINDLMSALKTDPQTEMQMYQLPKSEIVSCERMEILRNVTDAFCRKTSSFGVDW